MLQPLEGIPSDAGRHKFMVQSCVAPAEDLQDLESIWKVVDPAELTYSKLMVTFVDNKNPASGDDNKTFTMNNRHEETFASTGQAQELGNSYPGNTSQQDGTVASLRKSLKSTIDEKEELQKKVHGLEQEIEVMLKKNRKLQQTQSNGSLDNGAFPTLQFILIVLAALLIGAIGGHFI